MMSSYTVAAVFDRIWAREGSRVAIRTEDHDLTCRDLLRWSKAISRVLEPIVQQPGQRVALMLPNSAAFVASFFAIVRVGGVVAPLVTQCRLAELAQSLRDLNAVALVSGPAFVERALEGIPTLEMRPALVEVSMQHDARLLHSGQGVAPPLHSAASAPLLQQHTSGSTGVPKRVVRTHTAVLAELDALRATFEISGHDKFLGAAPFSHVNGLVRTMMTSMYVGGTLYPVEDFRRREILDLVTRERITFFGGVPRMFVVLGQTPMRGDVDLSSLRIVFSSSAPLLPADTRHFQSRYGVFVRQLYGSTETGTISFNRHSAPECCLQSVGTPIQGVRVEVVDEEGHSLAAGQEGEFAIASPFATAGYLDNPAATNESFRGDFYLSGDLGTKDEAGALTITGRKSLFINCGGFKVNPYEVEEVIKEHPKVIDVAVFGSPSPHGDQIVSCVVVARAECTAEEIHSHCSDRLADFKIPTRIQFRNVLPTSPTGKILRSKLLI